MVNRILKILWGFYPRVGSTPTPGTNCEESATVISRTILRTGGTALAVIAGFLIFSSQLWPCRAVAQSERQRARSPQVKEKGASWKTFSNRAGWSIKYPPGWTIGSCRNCSDPTDPEVFVDFFPPMSPRETNSDEGWVIIQNLGRKPTGQTIDEWFLQIKQASNQNPRLKEESMELNGLPALRVRYRNPYNGGHEFDTVYVVAGVKSFSISFSGNRGGVTIENLRNYPVFVQMLLTFTVNR